jgi:hypothetical protein
LNFAPSALKWFNSIVEPVPFYVQFTEQTQDVSCFDRTGVLLPKNSSMLVGAVVRAEPTLYAIAAGGTLM